MVEAIVTIPLMSKLDSRKAARRDRPAAGRDESVHDPLDRRMEAVCPPRLVLR